MAKAPMRVLKKDYKKATYEPIVKGKKGELTVKKAVKLKNDFDKAKK